MPTENARHRATSCCERPHPSRTINASSITCIVILLPRIANSYPVNVRSLGLPSPRADPAHHDRAGVRFQSESWLTLARIISRVEPLPRPRHIVAPKRRIPKIVPLRGRHAGDALLACRVRGAGNLGHPRCRFAVRDVRGSARPAVHQAARDTLHHQPRQLAEYGGDRTEHHVRPMLGTMDSGHRDHAHRECGRGPCRQCRRTLIDWHFTATDTRIKLKRLYPTLKVLRWYWD